MTLTTVPASPRSIRRLAAWCIVVGLGGCTLIPADAESPYDVVDGREKVLAAATRQQALEYLPSGASMEWRAADGRASGRITPTRTFGAPNGLYCREFEESVTAGPFADRFTDLRCRNDDGRWMIPAGG
ncbi:MAG TPA: hypothetical protein VK943_20290 [Arenibaculum sp.]|nr:hypothetical protein [Arenibaculum sp.]